MREVVIQSWCDECAADGVRTAAEAIDIMWRNREVALDLCEEHALPLREMDRIIGTYGHTRKVGPKKKSKADASNGEGGKVSPSHAFLLPDGNYQCPNCERTFQTPQGLGAHRSRNHNYRPN